MWCVEKSLTLHTVHTFGRVSLPGRSKTNLFSNEVLLVYIIGGCSTSQRSTVFDNTEVLI